MTNSENPKQLTVGQLMGALGQCNQDDLVKLYNTDAVSLHDVAFVERYATGKTVYLHSENPDLDNFFSPAGLDENADPVIKIIKTNENFAETIWEQFIQTDKTTKIMYARINFDDLRVYNAQDDLWKDSWWIDGYMMPNGEFRLDVGDAAVLLGYGRNGWSKVFESFEKLGSFQLITSPKPAPTISLSCFIALTILEAESLKNKYAALIRSRFTLEKLTSKFQDAFDLKKTVIQPSGNTI